MYGVPQKKFSLFWEHVTFHNLCLLQGIYVNIVDKTIVLGYASDDSSIIFTYQSVHYIIINTTRSRNVTQVNSTQPLAYI